MIQHRDGVLRIVWHGGDRFDIQVRRHAVRVDQPPDSCGGDTGPAPVELLVGSLAASVAQYAERYLHRCELPAGVAVTARYELGLRPGRVDRVELTVEAPGLPEGLRGSFSSVLEHCPVYNTLSVPPEIDFHVLTAERDDSLTRPPLD